MVYQHQGMLLQNLHRHYLYMVIKLPKLEDLDQKILMFPNCDNYSVQRSSNPNPTSDDFKLNDNALHQQKCTHFNVDYLEEMNIIKQVKRQIEQKINVTPLALLLTKHYSDIKGAGNSYRFKRATALRLQRKESSTNNGNITGMCSNRRNFD